MLKEKFSFSRILSALENTFQIAALYKEFEDLARTLYFDQKAQLCSVLLILYDKKSFAKKRKQLKFTFLLGT